MKLALGLIIGIILGAVSMQAANQLVQVSYIPDAYEYEELLSHESVAIVSSSFHCESETNRTVGGVLSAIYHSNSNGYINRINESCIAGSCQITYSNCKPWQSDGCGSTSLLFEVYDNRKINPKSFKCVQVP